MREDAYRDWTSAFTLLDTMETFFDSRIDLIQRQLSKRTEKLRMRAEHIVKTSKVRTPGGEDLDREVQKMKLKMTARITNLTQAWHSAKVVRTREKISFFFGVHSLLASALLFGMAPEWVHVAYSIQALYLLPLRWYKYKKRAWHYFLFDLCYYTTILNLVYIWIFPASPALWVACYCLSHGSLASAVITWRNSLVFHDQDKVTSLFIHIYPPFTFTTMRHYYPNVGQRFPALAVVEHLQPVRALLISSMIYVIWQLLYWKFVMVNRRAKIESGERTTSFSFLINDKRGAIGRMLSGIAPQYRELAFMGGQLLYGLLTEIPAVFLLYDSPRWSGLFLIAIFAVSVWNGGGFYIEVFGRKFERELEALRKELADATARSTSLSGRSSPQSDEIITPLQSPELTGLKKDFSPKMPSIDLAMSPALLTPANSGGHEKTE